jgi:KDO2-lipid IV(A) lauroyltransferase
MTIKSMRRAKIPQHKIKKNTSLVHVRQWPFWIMAGILWCFVKLFSYAQLIKIGKIIGLLTYCFSFKQKKIARINIQKCFPHYLASQKKNLLRACFINLGIGLIESAMSWWASDKTLRKLIHIKGLEHVKEALAKKQGLLIFVPHFFSLYLCGRLANMIHPFGVMFFPPKNPVFRWITQRYVKRSYSFAVTRDDARGLIKALKNNQALFYTPDTDPGKRFGEFIPFFGVMAKTLTATGRFSQLTNCAVIPLDYSRRVDGAGYELQFLPMLENYPSKDNFQDAQLINQIIEKIILAHVEQYVWQYKRFKTRPVGEKSFYSE